MDSTQMTAPTRNSMAALLTVLVTVVVWLTVIIGGIAFVLLALGLTASLNGGAVDMPIGSALAEGVNPATFIAVMAGLVAVAPAIIYICVQLRRILATLAIGDPFVPENAPRFTRIAIAIALMELARYTAILLLRLFVDFGEDVAAPRYSVNLAAWVAAAALLVLSQVFREGARLREEEKMTI